MRDGERPRRIERRHAACFGDEHAETNRGARRSDCGHHCSSGAVRYRTPANISPDGLKVASGRLYCFSHERGSTEDRIRAGLEGMNSPTSWWLFDLQQNQVSRSDPPVFASPDGRYVVSPNKTLLHVTTPDGKAVFDVRLQFAMYTPEWLGAH